MKVESKLATAGSKTAKSDRYITTINIKTIERTVSICIPLYRFVRSFVRSLHLPRREARTDRHGRTSVGEGEESVWKVQAETTWHSVSRCAYTRRAWHEPQYGSAVRWSCRSLAFGRTLVGHDRRWPARWTSSSWSHADSATSASSGRSLAVPRRDSHRRLSVEIELARASYRAASTRARGEKKRQREGEIRIPSAFGWRDREHDKEGGRVRKRECLHICVCVCVWDEVSPSRSENPYSRCLSARNRCQTEREAEFARPQRRCSLGRARLRLLFFFSSFRERTKVPPAPFALLHSSVSYDSANAGRVSETVNTTIEPRGRAALIKENTQEKQRENRSIYIARDRRERDRYFTRACIYIYITVNVLSIHVNV